MPILKPHIFQIEKCANDFDYTGKIKREREGESLRFPYEVSGKGNYRDEENQKPERRVPKTSSILQKKNR